MFWRKKKYNMEMLKMIKPTSKVALKMQTLMIAKGNVEEADLNNVSHGLFEP